MTVAWGNLEPKYARNSSILVPGCCEFLMQGTVDLVCRLPKLLYFRVSE